MQGPDGIITVDFGSAFLSGDFCCVDGETMKLVAIKEKAMKKVPEYLRALYHRQVWLSVFDTHVVTLFDTYFVTLFGTLFLTYLHTHSYTFSNGIFLTIDVVEAGGARRPCCNHCGISNRRWKAPSTTGDGTRAITSRVRPS